MKGLEDYIRANAGAFDTEALPEGAEERFLKKWEAGRRKVRIFRIVLPAAAAAVLAVLLLLPSAGARRDWLRGADTPEGIYRSYMAQVAKAWEEAGPDDMLAAQLRSLTDESIPLVELLPEELDDASQAAILKEHYNTLLDGVHQLMKTKKTN